ncbi:pentatricopeptide repeat-containing protein, partial [Trifolium medium]|nr:pentatricopeptide repeat-containing protein [Trifolium medium]
LYASFGELGDVEKLFRRIDDKDIVAWNSMILARARPGRGSGCSMELLQELRRTTNLQIEGATLVAVLKSCKNESDLPAAFVDIVYKDDSSWSSIIGTYKQNGMESKALELCKEMLAEGINFTSYSLPLCISACSQLSAIYEGKQLHVFAIKSGYNCDVYVGSSIIDMYAKCGNMKESEKVFDEQLEPNEVIFNAMICGYAHHGKAQEA